MARLLLPLFLIMFTMLPGYFTRSPLDVVYHSCYVSCMSCIMVSYHYCPIDSVFPSGSEFCMYNRCNDFEVTREHEAKVVIELMNCRTSSNVDNCVQMATGIPFTKQKHY